MSVVGGVGGDAVALFVSVALGRVEASTCGFVMRFNRTNVSAPAPSKLAITAAMTKVRRLRRVGNEVFVVDSPTYVIADAAPSDIGFFVASDGAESLVLDTEPELRSMTVAASGSGDGEAFVLVGRVRVSAGEDVLPRAV